jgi:hypothetical protein
LRRASAIGFAAAHGLLHSVAVFTDDRGFEPLLDEVQEPPIDNALGHHSHQLGVRNAVKVLRQIGVYDVGVACPQRVGDVVHGIVSRFLGPKSVRVRTEVGLENRFDDELHRHLRDPVA